MQYQRAFTLVEILVVLVISTILAGITLLSLRNASEDDLLREDLNRLAGLLQRNCQDALVYGQHLGIHVADDGYEVFRYDGANWIGIKAESAIYRHRNWSKDWQLQLTFQGLDTTIDESGQTPQLICLGSGELLPFRFTLSDGLNASLALSGLANGSMTVETIR
jgi:general secretion pathway protein H